MPGLRLGYMIVPDALQDEIAMAKHATDISTSGLLQRAFDLYIRKGLWDRQIIHMKRIYDKRHAVIAGYLKNHEVPWIHYHLPQGGYNYWITMDPALNADELMWRLSKKGVAILSGSTFYHLQLKSSSFRLSIAAISEQEIETGLEILYKEIETMVKEGSAVKSGTMKSQVL